MDLLVLSSSSKGLYYAQLSSVISDCGRFLMALCPFLSSPNFVLMTTLKKPVKVSQGSTYSELLSVIEEMSREIRPTYAGSKSAMERLKRGILPFSLHRVFYRMVC